MQISYNLKNIVSLLRQSKPPKKMRYDLVNPTFFSSLLQSYSMQFLEQNPKNL